MKNGGDGSPKWRRRANLRVALTGLSDDQLVHALPRGRLGCFRQVVHHLADAHINGFVRFKLALTKTIRRSKAYEETLWADTIDGREARSNYR